MPKKNSVRKTKQKKRKISSDTKVTMEQKRKLREENARQRELNSFNKDISKAIKKY